MGTLVISSALFTDELVGCHWWLLVFPKLPLLRARPVQAIPHVRPSVCSLSTGEARTFERTKPGTEAGKSI